MCSEEFGGNSKFVGIIGFGGRVVGVKPRMEKNIKISKKQNMTTRKVGLCRVRRLLKDLLILLH